MESVTSSVPLRGLLASRKEQLQRISDAGLVAQGRVFLLSLEPIKLQLDHRWPTRSEVVWEAAERLLHKSLPSPDVFVRVNETAILVAVASTDSYTGQVKCVEVLRSLLTFFLGKSADADIELSRISELQGESLSSAPVDLNAPPAPQPAPDENEQPCAPENWIPPLVERRTQGLVSLSHYGKVAYEIDVVPVWRLDREIISAYALRLRLSAGLENFSDIDNEKLGNLVIDHLLPILVDYRKHGGLFALIVPFSFSTLAARRPRAALFNRCAPFHEIMRRAVICEISDLHIGIPSGLIREAVAMIKPFVRVITANVRTIAELTAVYREAPFHGIAVNAREGNHDVLKNLLRISRRRTPNLIVHGARSNTDLEWLRACEATHVTWKS